MTTFAATGRLTVAELYAAPDDGVRRELIDGELIVTPPPSIWHQVHQSRLMDVLRSAIEPEGGIVLAAPVELRGGLGTATQPDIVVLGADSLERYLDAGLIDQPVRLIVEILSPSTAAYDLGLKTAWYARFGQQSFWILDPIEKSLSALELHSDGYRTVAKATFPAPFQAPPFPDTVIALTRLWARPG
jgi:Uma2 family endonuclease